MTAREYAAALKASGDQYHADGDYAAFTARQSALWGAVNVRSLRFRRMVSDALRGMLQP